MSRRKRWLAVVLLALVAGVGFWVALALREPEHPVTPELVAQIQDGMTPGEVEAIIGLPPGGYRPDVLTWPGRIKNSPASVWQNGRKKVTVHETLFWLLDSGSIEVGLGESGRVVYVTASFYTPWRRLEMQFWQLMRF